MNFLSKRKLGKNSNPIVRLAITHFDRPTDLKNALLNSNLNDKELKSYVLESLVILEKYPPVTNDIRLAYLRTVCSTTPSKYAEIISIFPDLLNDTRAAKSIQLYKNKTLNLFLGIEEDVEDETSTNIVYTFDDSMFEHIDYTQYETKFDDDFGLIEYADLSERTLNQLRGRIQNLILVEGMVLMENLLEEIQHYLIKYEYSNRATSDFFVASLRALGDIDADAGVHFGRKFLSRSPIIEECDPWFSF